jgi:prepilin-type N-terminal cleavage/methylation domain-containing protein
VGVASVQESRRGFSLLELMIVLVIMMSVAVIAMPHFLNYMAVYTLRNTLSQSASFLQNVRMTAIRLNTTLTITTGTNQGEGIAWVNLPGGTANWDAGEPGIQLPRSVTVPSSGHPGIQAGLGTFTAEPSSVPISFNARGLPCVTSGTMCQNFDAANNQQVGFVVYFQNTGLFGNTQWGAVTVAPEGRIRTWLWNGSYFEGQ